MDATTTFILFLGLIIGLGMVGFGLYTMFKNKKDAYPIEEEYERPAIDDRSYEPITPQPVAIENKATHDIEVSHSVKTNAYKVRDSVRMAHDIEDDLMQSRGYLAMLCDGVNFDEDTPAYISKRIMDEYYSLDRGNESIQDFFEANIDELDAEIVKFSSNGKAGTSLLACVLLDKELYIIGVGGARLYHIRGNNIKKLTSEHRYSIELEAQVKAGEIDEIEADNHPRRNELISYIGVGGINYIDMNDLPIMMNDDDILLFCSDGLYNILDEDEIMDVIDEYVGEFKNCAKAITAAAMDTAGDAKDDDISVLMIRIGKQDDL